MTLHASASLIESTERLLLQGGDARIALDPARGLNKYLCRPVPEGGVAAFGSSTASSISAPAFAAADRLRRALQGALEEQAPAALYARELQRMRGELAHCCGLAGLPGLGTVFAASGTDVHLLAAQLAAGAGAAPTTVIMMDETETGSGVPAALRGEHFSECSALGVRAPAGSGLAGRHAIEVATIALRGADGAARAAGTVDLDVEALALGALKRGRRVLLVALDVSKTGLLAPGPSCLRELQRFAPERVEVLVDACQFRIGAATLRGYLEAGFMVALTGSKFLTGPAFSGALLIPPPLAARACRSRLPRALAAYSARAEWPAGWAAAETLDDHANFGLLLRWEAALAELRAFRRVPDEQAVQVLQAFARAVNTRLHGDPCFLPLPVPAIERGASGWDRIQTIFPFLPCRRTHSGGTAPLSEAETAQVYRLLQADLRGIGGLPDSAADRRQAAFRCLLGQPVRGTRHGAPVGALRLCASARLVSESCAGGRARPQAAIEAALAALDKAAWLVRRGLVRPHEAAVAA